jgi:hypothetical protein
MKWLAAGLTFVNVATVCALLLGILGHGLSRPIAIASTIIGAGLATLAALQTLDPEERNSEESSSAGTGARACFWLLAACFGFFAFRSFCWLIFSDGTQLKVQSPNNLGDLALHIAYVKNFANGVPLWPENPIYVFSHMRYPAGTDLFNALLLLLRVEITRGFIWTGLVASLATFYALYRWGGLFTVAGFLFNGGLMGFRFLSTWKLPDYHAEQSIAWKNLALTMFVTQRGLLYALPAGLLLLYQWRTKYVTADAGRDQRSRLQPLPYWLEALLYATMPLFHLHTFMALSIVAAFLFAVGEKDTRWQLGKLVVIAFLPATFFVWTITDHFQARSLLQWKPGWVQTDHDLGGPFLQFWFVNFGLWPLFVIALLVFCVWRAAKRERFDFREHQALAFLAPAALLFLFAWLVKTAPWAWDNIKLIIWAYLIMLPFLWRELIAPWPKFVVPGVLVVLFLPGFVFLLGGLVGKENGFGLADRAEVDAVGAAVRKLPVTARFASYPTYNHPLLLQGRKVVMGYPGHLWTQGFEYAETNKRLDALMNGAADWREQARRLQARYLFWGREEKTHYTASARLWEREAQLLASGPWGAIYDLEAGPAGVRE